VKANYIKNIIANEGVEFVCLQEKRTVEFSDSRCFSLWGDNKVGWVPNEGVNGAGSTLSMWHKEAFAYSSHVVGRGFIAVAGHHVKSNCSCIIANVYTTCSLSDKIELLEALSALRSLHQDKMWCCCGDFNAVRCAEERRGVRENASNKNEIRGFNDFIGRNLMEDLPIVGKKYTWYKADGSAKSRLDRVLLLGLGFFLDPLLLSFVFLVRLLEGFHGIHELL